MSVRIITAHVLDGLAMLSDESVRCVVTSLNDGRFRKGERRSPATEFKPGTHWRKPQAFREKAWLEAEYVTAGRSTGEIAAQFGVKDAAIFFWLRRHGIPRRSISEARTKKHWGSSGSDNPMFGRFGADSPNFIDGSSPERQRLYARAEGREFIKAWAGNEALRFDVANGVTLCRPCHSWVHSKANIAREYLG